MAQTFSFEEANAPDRTIEGATGAKTFSFDEALAEPSKGPDVAAMASATRAAVGTIGQVISAFDRALEYQGAPTEQDFTQPVPVDAVGVDRFGQPLDPRGPNPSGENPYAQTRLTGSEGLAPLMRPLIPIRDMFTQGAQLEYLAGEQPAGTARETLKAAAGVVKGAEDVVGGGLEFMTSPVGVGTGLLGLAPAIMRSIASGAFAVDMASHAPEALDEYKAAAAAGDEEGKARALVKGIGNVVMAGMATLHSVGEGRTGLAGTAGDLAKMLDEEVKATGKTDPNDVGAIRGQTLTQWDAPVTAMAVKSVAPDEYYDRETGTRTPITKAATEAVTEKGPNAVSIESPNAEVLRPEGSKVGLPQVGARNPESKEPAAAQTETAQGGSAEKPVEFKDRFPVGAKVEFVPAGALEGGVIESGTVIGHKVDPTTKETFAEIELPSGRKDFAGDINDIRKVEEKAPALAETQMPAGVEPTEWKHQRAQDLVDRWRAGNIEGMSKEELGFIAQINKWPYTGTVAQLTERIKARSELLNSLKGKTLDDLTALSGKELDAMLKVGNLFKASNKKGKAISLIKFRETSIHTQNSFNRELNAQFEVKKASDAKEPIPAKLAETAKARVHLEKEGYKLVGDTWEHTGRPQVAEIEGEKLTASQIKAEVDRVQKLIDQGKFISAGAQERIDSGKTPQFDENDKNTIDRYNKSIPELEKRLADWTKAWEEASGEKAPAPETPGPAPATAASESGKAGPVSDTGLAPSAKDIVAPEPGSDKGTSEQTLTKGEAKFAGYQFDMPDKPTYQIPGARPGIMRNVDAEGARKAGYTVPEKIPGFDEWKAGQNAELEADKAKAKAGIAENKEKAKAEIEESKADAQERAKAKAEIDKLKERMEGNRVRRREHMLDMLGRDHDLTGQQAEMVLDAHKGLGPNASPEDLQKAYLKLALPSDMPAEVGLGKVASIKGAREVLKALNDVPALIKESKAKTPPAAAQAEVTDVAKKEGPRAAQDIKDELIAEIQEKLMKAPAEAKEGDKVTIDIPGDGTFTVPNNIDALSEMLAKAKKIKTDAGKVPGVSKEALKTSQKTAHIRIADAEARARAEKEAEAKAKKEAETKPGEDINTGALGEKGMGGAKPTEFDKPGTYVSNMFAAIEEDRAANGKPPLPETQTRTWSEDNAKALAKMNREPDWIPNLIKEVAANPRPLLSWENAGMIWQRHKWRAEANNAFRRINEEYDNGRPDFLAEAQLDAARFEDLLDEMDRAVGPNGTGSEAGRSLKAQQMASGEDFSLVELRSRERASKGGKPLTEDESKQIAELYKKLEKAREETANAEARAKQAEIDRDLAQTKADAKGAPDYDPRVLQAAEKFAKFMDKKGDDALARIKARLGNTSAAVDPTILSDVAILGAAKITRGLVDKTKWASAMIRDVGEWLREHIDEAWDKAQAQFNSDSDSFHKGVDRATVEKIKRAPEDFAGRIEDVGGKIKAKQEQGKGSEITPFVKKLERILVEQDLNIGRDQLVDKIHEILKEVIPGITRLETMDAMTGRGQFWEPPQDVVSKTVRDLNTQIRLVAHQVDVEAGRPMPRTGYQPDKMSDAARREQQKLNDLKRRYGVVVTDPTAQLGSVLNARKTYYKNRISDLQAEIAARERIVKNKAGSPTDPELEALREEYAKVKAEHNDIFKAGITQEQRLQRAITAAERAERLAEEKLARAEKGDFTTKKPTPMSSPELDQIRARTAALREATQELKDLANPKKTPEQIALQSLKTRLATQKADLLDRMARGDFSKKVRRPVTPDAELLNAQADVQRIKREFEKRRLANEMATRTKTQKFFDAVLRLRREFVLSGISSIGKLASYSVQEFGITPLKEAAGAVLSKLPLVRQVAARAPSEAPHGSFGSEVRGLVNDYVAAFTKGIRDARDVFKTGESQLKVLNDKSTRLPDEFRAFFGTLHQMEKSPLIRFGFERSFRRRMELAGQQGVDVSDITVQQRISVDAYEDALRGALINRNAVVNKVNRFIHSLEEKSKVTGRVPGLGSAARFVAGAELPVQHVPANYVARTAEYIFGSVTGSVKLANAFRRGIDNLAPAEADQIMRHLKAGSIGGAAMLLAFLKPEMFGGFWSPATSGKKQELKPGEIKLGDTTIRSWATHNQILNAMQFAATVRKIADAKFRRKDKEPAGLSAGAQAALFGLAEETPYVHEITDYVKAADPRTSGKFWDEKIKGYVIPQGVSQAAELLDLDENMRATKRKPTNLLETLKMGIPFARETVPKARPTRR